MRGSAWPAKGTVLEAALHHVADVVGVEGVVGELADLADRRAGQRGIVGCLLQACRLEVVSINRLFPQACVILGSFPRLFGITLQVVRTSS